MTTHIDKPTLLRIFKLLRDEIHFEFFMYLNNNKDYGTFDNIVNKYELSKSKCTIDLLHLITVLSQYKTYIENYDYTKLIDYLYKSTWEKNTLETEPNFMNDEANSSIKKIAEILINRNIKYRDSLVNDPNYYQNNNYIDIYKSGIDYHINQFKKEIPRKISYTINIIIEFIAFSINIDKMKK